MRRTLLHGGQVFDSRAGTVHEADVVVEGERVVETGPGLDADEMVDVSGATVLPGLFDCHVHLGFTTLDEASTLHEPETLRYYQAVVNAATTLRLGITTVRDAGFLDTGIRTAIERGLVPGPRVRMAVTMVSQTGGHADGWMSSGAEFPPAPGIPDSLVDGVDSARRVVRELVRAGADQIKIATTGGGLSAHTDPHVAQLRPDELAEIVAEAGAAGRYVMAHAHATGGVLAAVRAGVRSIEHGTMLDEETVALMVDRGTWLVPTLVAPHGVLEAARSGASLPPGSEEKALELVVRSEESFRLAVAAGVPVAMGTDAPVMPHGRNLEEITLMHRYGMPAGQAWSAATWSAARLMRLEDQVGSLEPGKRADILVLDGSADDVEGLAERVREVWQDGRVVHRRGAGGASGRVSTPG